MSDVICDLDGVLYKGDHPIAGASQALERLVAAGLRLTFVTNNSTRSQAHTAANITTITGVDVSPDQVVTSSMAAASMLTEADRPALVVGEEGVRAALLETGVPITDDSSVARSVVVGMYRDIGYGDIADAADAVRAGARFVATNNDPTYPTADRLLPGAGSVVAAIATAAGRSPEVAGKPHQAMRELLHSRGVGPGWVVGDRLDTDIALADGNDEWTSILVLSGVTGAEEARSASCYVVADFSEAVTLILSGEGG